MRAALTATQKAAKSDYDHRRRHLLRDKDRLRRVARTDADRERIKEYNKHYREQNIERVKAQKSIYAFLNKNAISSKRKAVYAANRETKLAAVKKWARTNPDVVNARNAKHRASKLRATPSWANSFIIREAYHLAKLRTKATGIKWHVDHIVPLRSKIVCGLHVQNNLQVIPASENHKKNNLVWPQMPL